MCIGIIFSIPFDSYSYSMFISLYFIYSYLDLIESCN